MSTSTNAFAVCGKSFKNLQSHLAHSLACQSFYMSRVNAAAIVAPTIPNDSVVNTTNALQGANCRTFPNSRTSYSKSGATVRGEAGDPLHNVKDMNATVEEDNFVMFHDSILSDGDTGNKDSSQENEEEEGPDVSVLDLCLELFNLRANPLGLLRFSPEEKVQIELLDLLRKLHCPLKAFTDTLKWAAKSNASGRVFHEGYQPTREKIITKLYER